MIVRCGACRTQFEVSGAGRFTCPVCGSVNVVRGAPGSAPQSPPQQTVGGYPAATDVLAPNQAPPSPRDQPSPRVGCPDCGFTFIVGDIAVAKCPNCGADVPTGREEPPQP